MAHGTPPANSASATRIAAAPGPFGREAVALLDALHARIRHEDRELLPLAESL